MFITCMCCLHNLTHLYHIHILQNVQVCVCVCCAWCFLHTLLKENNVTPPNNRKPRHYTYNHPPISLDFCCDRRHRPVVSFHLVHQEHRSRLPSPKSPGRIFGRVSSSKSSELNKKKGFKPLPAKRILIITSDTMPWIYRMLARHITTRIRHETCLGSRESQLLNLYLALLLGSG